MLWADTIIDVDDAPVREMTLWKFMENPQRKICIDSACNDLCLHGIWAWEKTVPWEYTNDCGCKQVFICATIRNSCFLLFIFLLGQKYLFELKLYKHTYYVDMVACPTRKIFFSLECVPTCTGTREYSGSFSMEHRVICARVKAQNLRCSKQPKWWAFIYNMHEES